MISATVRAWLALPKWTCRETKAQLLHHSLQLVSRQIPNYSMGNLWSLQTAEHDEWKSDAQYAMESGTYCVICGNPFDIEGDVYNLDPKEPRYQVRIL
jgi:hypothetical protein